MWYSSSVCTLELVHPSLYAPRRRLVSSQGSIERPSRTAGSEIRRPLPGGARGALAADQHQRLVTVPLHEFLRVALYVQAEQRLGIGRPHVEPPIGVADRHAVEMIDFRVTVLPFDFGELGGDIGDPAVDLAGTEACVDRRDNFAHRLVGVAEQLQALHERDHPGVGEPVVPEIEMPGMFAAERYVLLAHDRLYQRMSDGRADRDPAGS